MDTSTISVEGCEFIVPVAIKQYWPRYLDIDEFPSFCGAGNGFGDSIVPEKMLGLKVAPACFIHDLSWEICELSWAGFHQSNSMFLHNLQQIIINRSSSEILKMIRLYRAVTYFNAVDSVGAHFFWERKETLEPLKNPVVQEKFALVGVRL